MSAFTKKVEVIDPQESCTPVLSTLYGLPWLGAGTAHCESLRSYIWRLAFAHCVRPAYLIKTFVQPYMEGGRSSMLWATHGSGRSLSLSTNSLQLRAIVDRLSVLTGLEMITSASLQSLLSVVSSAGLVSRVERFCPACYADPALPLYGQILWDFDVVKACSRHKLRLVRTSCGSPSEERIRSWREAPFLRGVCSRCASIGMLCNRESAVAATAGEIRVAQETGELIALASGGAETTKACLIHGLAMCADELGGKSAMSRAIGAGLSVCQQRTRLHVKPTMPMLLATAKASHRTLVSIFFPELYEQTIWPEEVLDLPQKTRQRGPNPALDEAIARAQASYAGVTSSPVPAKAVERSLGITHMARRAPELYKAAVAAHRQFRQEAKSSCERELQARITVAYAQLGPGASTFRYAKHLGIRRSPWRMKVLLEHLERLRTT